MHSCFTAQVPPPCRLIDSGWSHKALQSPYCPRRSGAPHGTVGTADRAQITSLAQPQPGAAGRLGKPRIHVSGKLALITRSSVTAATTAASSAATQAAGLPAPAYHAGGLACLTALVGGRRGGLAPCSPAASAAATLDVPPVSSWGRPQRTHRHPAHPATGSSSVITHICPSFILLPVSITPAGKLSCLCCCCHLCCRTHATFRCTLLC
jgi:hypothetical protein